jgi:hypothetical protein
VTQPHSYTLEIRYVDRPPEVRRIDAQRVGHRPRPRRHRTRRLAGLRGHAEIEFENGQLVVHPDVAGATMISAEVFTNAKLRTEFVGLILRK